MTRIKICGLRREKDILYANECRPDYVGFIFAKSKRQVTREQAAYLKGLLNPDIKAVGVFVNEEISVVADLAKEKIIDMIQLHGDETAEYMDKLRECVPDAKIIKAIRVASVQDIVKSNEVSADYLLFDSFSPKQYGGTGEVFDWSLIRNVHKPFFLAGGINIDNVEEAIAMSNAYAIDVSSAVETDGYKDREKMVDIVRKVRKC